MIQGAIACDQSTFFDLFVLAEVAGRVEELLRDDRGAELHLGDRTALARLRSAVVLEVLAHARCIEAYDLVAVEVAHLAVVVGDELHPQILCATSA